MAALTHSAPVLLVRDVAATEDPAPHDAVMPGLWDVYFWTDDADGLFAELRANGAAIIHEPRDQDYGSRECVVRDPDRHHIAFGQDL